MGRSFLSVQLALVFGICVAAVVLVAGGVTPTVVEIAPAAAEQSLQVRVKTAVHQEKGAEVCLWRGCPIMLPRPSSRTAEEAHSRADGPAHAS
jgi:hypothetical protein